ncbi:hypothetical protein CTheo_5579 [Ceratobasidium theobromae]|uniref:Uncharacterized protein n=1 Tax=Ceratobasidium theobromae TaxID=1582974 RepID=A0A5N5QI76_9AGAM|nr:hypothetical protein CTheo_5579 [Ceratobasidium theobromae]
MMPRFWNEQAGRIAKQAAGSLTPTPTPFFNRTTDFIRHFAKSKPCKSWAKRWRKFRRAHPNSATASHPGNSPRLKLHSVHKEPERHCNIYAQLIRARVMGDKRPTYIRLTNGIPPLVHAGLPSKTSTSRIFLSTALLIRVLAASSRG